jgi:hypothetical protein
MGWGPIWRKSRNSTVPLMVRRLGPSVSSSRSSRAETEPRCCGESCRDRAGSMTSCALRLRSSPTPEKPRSRSPRAFTAAPRSSKTPASLRPTRVPVRDPGGVAELRALHGETRHSPCQIVHRLPGNSPAPVGPDQANQLAGK